MTDLNRNNILHVRNSSVEEVYNTVPRKGFEQYQRNQAYGVKGMKPLIPKMYIRSHELLLPFYTFFNDDDKGFEIVGDFRLSKRFYVATELGYRDYTRQEDFFNF